jgi:hypothetical protein
MVEVTTTEQSFTEAISGVLGRAPRSTIYTVNGEQIILDAANIVVGQNHIEVVHPGLNTRRIIPNSSVAYVEVPAAW